MKWIEYQLKELGKSKTEFADFLGLAPARVSELIKGSRRMLAAEVLPTALFLGLPPLIVLALCSQDHHVAQLQSDQFVALSKLK